MAIRLLLQIITLSLCQLISTGNLEVEHDFRYISYQDLLPTSDRFTDENVTSFSRFLFDVSIDQVIIGARDNLYRTSLKLQLKEKETWEAPPAIRETCLTKGQSEEDCRNYIMVLHHYGSRLYACGTHAYSPNCSWRQIENLNVTKFDKGVAKCPFNPNANITTLMTDNGQLFVASPTDFSGSDPAILRVDNGEEGTRMLRTKQYDSKWLNDPQFVGSFEHGNFIYFVFRERALEHINCGKIIYSRIARVCKSDPGGTVFFKENWTSFIKARLNCSLPGEYPFYFDEIQGISYSPEEGVLYATFNTPPNSIQGSAICAFNISAIQTAFSGPFKYQENVQQAWHRVDLHNRAYQECQATESSVSRRSTNLMESTKYQLMDQAVQPITVRPLHYAKMERFTQIAVDIIPTKLHESVHIMYVATSEGLIKKISVLPRTKETCVIEIWRVESDPSSKIRTLQYLKETESLYVGTDTSVMRIYSQHCSRHLSKTSCLNAMDPYCGWNELHEQCTPAPNGNTLAKHWIQNPTECPILTSPIDGSWGAWSAWSKCAQNSENTEDITTNTDTCLCRTRKCDNPAPRNGGKSCTGMSISVTNCTVNGAWTEWSAWSACSQTCGIAVKTRRRTCGNPKPAHGGRVCVGPDRNEIYCTNLPPCPIPKPQAIDGAWGPWGNWGECSAPCGGGFRIRRRRCDNPTPQNGGLDCPGCHVDYEVCNTHGCPELKKTSSWTPWLMAINGTGTEGSHVERRFRFTCKAPVTESSILKLNLAKEETRVCYPDGTCQRSGSDGADDIGTIEWSSWSECSLPCGGGQQFRVPICEKNDCKGKVKMARACNTHACKGEWGCWSDWTPCSVSCGVGIRKRTRKCISVQDNQLFGTDCDGVNEEAEACEMPSCDCWSEWSVWSTCNEDGEKIRFRRCTVKNPGPKECQGEEKQTKICKQLITNEAHTLEREFYMSAGGWVILIFAFICSILITFIVTKVILTPKPPKLTHIQASTGFGFPNQYSSLPTKEMDFRDFTDNKPKRQSSFNGGSRSNGNGTLLKSNNVNNTPKVLAKTYTESDTATIKRNSHLNNTKMRIMDDEEKY